MRFDWTPAKHERTVAERGSGFDFAAGIFSGATIEREDDRRDYGERRGLAIGAVLGSKLTKANDPHRYQRFSLPPN